MRVRVSYVVEVDDMIRREINAYYGKPGLASRAEVQAWYEARGLQMDDDLSWNAQMRDQGQAA
jgi:hypothetical protein